MEKGEFYSFCGRSGRRCAWYPEICDVHDERGDWEFHAKQDEELAKEGDDDTD